MKQKLIMHAGLHRSGTTSIQTYLAQNRAGIENAGFLYPGAKDEINHHHVVAHCYFGRNMRYLSDYLEEYRSSDHNAIIILSSEEFSTMFLDEAFAKAFFEFYEQHFEISIAMCLRRQDLLVESIFREIIRDGLPRNLYLNDYYELDHWKRYRILINIFGKKNVFIWGYNQENAVSRFCQVVGLPATLFPKVSNEIRVNQSMHRRKAIAIEKFASVEVRDRTALMDRLLCYRGVYDDGVKHIMSPRERAFLIERYEAGNTKLLLSIGSMPETIFQEKSPYEDVWFPAEPLSQTEVINLAVYLWDTNGQP